MSLVTVQIPETTLEQLHRLAASENSTLDRVVAEALEYVVKSAEQREYLRQRAARGRSVNLKALLDKAPDVPPIPGDELPD